jgi:hypothetical protein
MHNSKPANDPEKRRMAQVAELGCLCCRQLTYLTPKIGEWAPAEVHHLLDGGQRRGHLFTIGLCAWHHRGVLRYGYCRQGMDEEFGPSLAHGTRPFRERWGTDEQLLAMQNRLIELLEAISSP